MAGFNFIEQVVGPDAMMIVTASGISAALFGIAAVAKGKLAGKENPIIPDEKLTLVNFWDLVVSFLVNVCDGAMGKENRRFIPFVGSVFVFILCCNLLGLVPGFAAPTSAVTFNLGVALVVFIAYHVWGIRETGLGHYIAHFGMVKVPRKNVLGFIGMGAIWIFLFCVEMISHAVRPLSLSLRLFGNMLGDHTVLSIFTDLIGSWGGAAIFYFMGTFVSFVQAFIFAVLTMVYIKISCAHEEEGHDH